MCGQIEGGKGFIHEMYIVQGRSFDQRLACLNLSSHGPTVQATNIQESHKRMPTYSTRPKRQHDAFGKTQKHTSRQTCPTKMPQSKGIGIPSPPASGAPTISTPPSKSSALSRVHYLRITRKRINLEVIGRSVIGTSNSKIAW